MKAYRGEVKTLDGWRPVTRWYASRDAANRRLRHYCDDHGLCYSSQLVRGIERGGESIRSINEYLREDGGER